MDLEQEGVPIISLKAKITATVALLVALFISLGAWAGLRFFEQQFRESIFGQQHAMVSAMADEVDGKIATFNNELITVAKRITPEILADRRQAQKFMDEREDARLIFDNSLFIFLPSGKILAGAPLTPETETTDFSFREYFRKTMETKRPYISEPYFSVQQHHHPVVMFTAPVFDARGNVVAFLGGSIDLLKDNFLGRIATARIGRTGYFYLFNSARKLLVHPDRGRILKDTVRPGANHLFDRAVEGFEGSGETVTSWGGPMVSSFKRLKTAGWVLAASYPQAEAYAAIYRTREYILGAVPVVLLLSMVTAWLVTNLLAAPLLRFTEHVKRVAGEDDGRHEPIRIDSRDEIGALATAFNQMLAELASRKNTVLEQKDFSENLVQNSTIPTFVLDAQHRVIIWNKACERLTGIGAAEMVGTDEKWRAFFPARRPCLADLVIDGKMASLAEHYQVYGSSDLAPEGVWSEGWFPGLAGRDRFLLFSAAPLRNGRGELIGAIETFEDITDRKRTEEQLRKLSRAAEQSPATVVITDVVGNIEYVNPKFTELTGYTQEEVPGLTPRILKGEEKPAGFYRELWETLKAGREWRGEFRNRKKNGELYWEYALISPMKNADGAITHFIAAKEDITERKKAQEEMKRALSLLHATLESTADGILVRDLSGEVIIYNGRFAEMWRLPEPVLATKNDKAMRTAVLHQLKDPAKFLALTERLYVEQEDESRDILEFNDGRVFERVSRPQFVENRIVGRVISFRDVTEQKKLEHQLRHAQKMEAVGTLTGGIAHDFNNILTAIIGYADLMQTKMGEADPLRRYLSQIVAAGERAASLTKSLLAYSRKQPINPAPVDVNEIVKNVEKLLSRLIGEDIDFSTVLTGGRLTVLADSVQVEQVLMNLATNARDAIPDEGSLTIATRLAELDREFIRRHGYGVEGRYARISVADTGVGMDDNARERIFEPFYTTKETGKGTGLGLAIVYGIIKQHNGFIDVDSEPGKGTTFDIYLPIIAASAFTAPAEGCAAPQRRGRETILLVEDDRDVRGLEKDVLVENGYRVIEAVDGEDGVEKFTAHREEIDLLIIDVIMPKKNGKQVYEEIRETRGDLQAIFTSGYTGEILDRKDVLDEGLHFLQKPLTPNMLLAKVREVLDRDDKPGICR